jgi:uncharacterized membrane protein YkvA (DUF1232 family)
MGVKFQGDDDFKREFEKLRADADKKMDEVIKHEDDILSKAKTGALKKELTKVKLLMMALKDYITGEYREIPYGTITAIVAALFYVFLPVDVIPDFIPVVGLTDDAAVVLLAWQLVQEDIRKYAIWKAAKGDREAEELLREAFG